MRQEDKELLLKDLCARLPYNVVINCTEEDDRKTNFNCFLAPDMIKDIKSETAYWIIKPYLRPMSSMTEEEKIEYQLLCDYYMDDKGVKHYFNNIATMDWYHQKHFDCRGLIKLGIALEAPDNMYK